MTSADPTLTGAAQRVGAFLDVLEKMAGPNLHGERLSDLVHHEHGHVTLLASDLRVILGAALAAASPPAPACGQDIPGYGLCELPAGHDGDCAGAP